MLVLKLIILCSVVWVEGESETLDFLTPNRREMVHFFTSFFTPFSDMQDLVLRASEYGFPSYLRRAKKLPDAFIFNVPNATHAMPTEMSFHLFFKTLVDACKETTGRETSDSVLNATVATRVTKSSATIWTSNIRPHTYHTYLPHKELRMWRFSLSPLGTSYSEAHRALFFIKFLSSYQYSTGTVQHLPISVLAMHGWRIFFWMAISQMQNLYNTIPGLPKDRNGDKLTYSVPERLDELSSTFLFYLCAEIRRVKQDQLPTDIPTGFCPNPCATSPCLTIKHTTGPHCHLSGRGLFVNDFRCECKPGYRWVANIEIDENDASWIEGDTEVKTPFSDEVGSCIQVDICASYCHRKGTKRCDKVKGSITVICLCKVSFSVKFRS